MKTRERVVRFGDDRSLVGIVAEPEDAAAATARPTLIFLNAGLVHRVGPFRIYVSLARRLAGRGYRSLRFDLSGIGDSEPSARPLSEDARAAREARQAMDLLAATSPRGFVLVGLCSGADHSLIAADEDPRATGMILLDGPAFATPEFTMRRWLPVVTDVPRMARGVVRRVRRRVDTIKKPPAEPVEVFERAWPTRDQMAASLTRMLRRGGRILNVFTAGASRYYNYEGQFHDAFPDVPHRDRVEVSLFASADHTFTRRDDRAALLDRIEAWLDAGLDGAAATAGAAGAGNAAG